MNTGEAIADLMRWEGYTTWLYLCTAGKVTVGIGNMLPTADAAEALPFKLDGRPASLEAKRTAWHAVKAMEKGRAARAYASATKVRLDEADVVALASKRLERDFLPGLRNLYPGFDGFPEPVVRALIDMAYNLGVGGLGKFSRLQSAVLSGDWRAAAISCRRKSSRDERNEFVRQLFLEAAGP